MMLRRWRKRVSSECWNLPTQKLLPLPGQPFSPSALLLLLTPLIFSLSELFFRSLTQIMRCPTDSSLTYNEAGKVAGKWS